MMREWVYVRPTTRTACSSYINEALSFAAPNRIRGEQSVKL